MSTKIQSSAVEPTAGEWLTDATDHNPGSSVYTQCEGFRCVIATIHDADTPEGEANARLIIASRDMLAALKVDEPLLMKLATVAMNEKVAEFLPFGLLDEVKEWIKQSNGQAAIAKAEGGQ